MRYTFLLSFVLIFWACEPSSDQAADGGSNDNTEVIPSGTPNESMAKYLYALDRKQDPLKNPFLNERRVNYFLNERKMQEDAEKELLPLQYQIVDNVIQAGFLKEANSELSILRNMIQVYYDNNATDAATVQLFHIAGISYLKDGMYSNCVSNLNMACGYLNSGFKGTHFHQKMTRGAVKTYQTLLDAYPKDVVGKYLLNIGYMQLNEYPRYVPEEHLIAPDVWEKEGNYPPFEDVSLKAQITEISTGGGSVVDDFNNDGLLDMFWSGAELSAQLNYYQNNGDGTYTNRTTDAGIKDLSGGLNMKQADYNNDGFMDLLVLRGAWLNEGNFPNSLLRNNGDGTFTDVTRDVGIFSEHPSSTAAWADFDGDGFLDLFIGNETTASGEHPCELYLNMKNGTFKEVSAAVGMNIKNFVKGATWIDVNNDGLQDLFVSCLEEKNRLFMNKGGNDAGGWSFEESSNSGVDEPLESYNCWAWDYNNDGAEDLFVSSYPASKFGLFVADVAREFMGQDLESETAKLYRNDKNGGFVDATKEAGLDKAIFATAGTFEDFNNDGWLDFYVTTGEPNLNCYIPNRMFLNEGGKKFTEITQASEVGHLFNAMGVATGDMDNDGDVDILTNAGGLYEGDVYHKLLQRNTNTGNNWISLRVKGGGPEGNNAASIGALVAAVVERDGKEFPIFRRIGAGGSSSGGSTRLEIGIGDASKVNVLQIVWPNGNSLRFQNLPANAHFNAYEEQKTVDGVQHTTFEFQK